MVRRFTADLLSDKYGVTCQPGEVYRPVQYWWLLVTASHAHSLVQPGSLSIIIYCNLIRSPHSPRTPYFPWTNGLVKVQNENLGTHLAQKPWYAFLQNAPLDWGHQVRVFAYVQKAELLSFSHIQLLIMQTMLCVVK